jgi:CheY-like chemotaxis protein
MLHRTFVIIEDDPVTADIQKALLETDGHTVHVLLDALHSVDFVQRLKPDILLIDIMMPAMDGIEICRRLKSATELAALQMIVVTGKMYDADHRRALAAGARGVMVKPLDPRTFVDEILTRTLMM